MKVPEAASSRSRFEGGARDGLLNSDTPWNELVEHNDLTIYTISYDDEATLCLAGHVDNSGDNVLVVSSSQSKAFAASVLRFWANLQGKGRYSRTVVRKYIRLHTRDM